ncbi:MAG: discoidin domain-containing protein [Myxococcales bacterium]|nr:discoidin domain-containing protein [Myxococcales bacterium]
MKLTKSLLCSVFLLSSSAFAAPTTVASVSASSEYPADASGSYEAKKIADGKVSTAWVEGEDRNGLGANVTIELSKESEVAKIVFFAGMWYSKQYWDYSSRPTEVEVELDDGTKELVQIPNEMKPYTHMLKKPVKTRKVKITLRNVKSGSTFSDTGISEVLIYDTAPGDIVEVASATASSTAPDDADGNYDVANLYDNVQDTMWCEGNKASDGSGESLELTFKTKTTVKSFHLRNGIGTSLKYFMKGNRAQNVTLTFDDGSSQKVAVANTMLHKEYPLTPVAAKSVKITFDDVAKGKEFDDLCISEAYFGN